MPEIACPCPDLALLVEITRGSIVESRHFGAIAVVDATGRLLAHAGDPDLVSYLRSSAKPMQATAMVDSGAADAIGMTPAEIAISAASHNGEGFHVETVRRILTKIGLDADSLRCGLHAPLDPTTADRLVREGENPTTLHNNCSGKHAGMLAMARRLGAPVEGYSLPSHPVQQRILATVAAIARMDPAQIVQGVDGCGVPVFALPLRNAALAFARLADPRGLPAGLAAACRRVVGAMQAHPEMVAGTGRFDTDLMRQMAPRLFCKGGAEGYYGLGLLPDPSAGRPLGLGLAMKVADGDISDRALPVAVLEALEQLGALAEEDLRALAGWRHAETRNHRGEIVGQVRPALTLKEGE